jgi:hypothetical protein
MNFLFLKLFVTILNMGWVYPLDVHESIVTKEIAHENKGLGAFFFGERWGRREEKRREEGDKG